MKGSRARLIDAADGLCSILFFFPTDSAPAEVSTNNAIANAVENTIDQCVLSRHRSGSITHLGESWLQI